MSLRHLSHLVGSPLGRPLGFHSGRHWRFHSGCSADAANATAQQLVRSANAKFQLYMIDNHSPGSVFFLPAGTRLFNKLIAFMRLHHQRYGFEEVVTPLIFKPALWETSGHWQHYKGDMFQVSGATHQEHEPDGALHAASEFGLKPMNCPGHCLVFSRFERSYRDLPLRLSEFSPLHRNEASGALTGLTRVRKFHQDDGHIFCMPEQVESEMAACISMLDEVYRVFGLDDYKMVLSTRPQEYLGDLHVWDRAESALKTALTNSGAEWTVNPGDGAFYGPKIDVLAKDHNGKYHQTATIQLDFQLPQKFNLQYDAPHGKQQPVMIHRAIYGSVERFMSILIDHYQDRWPFWLSPRQAVVLPISEKHVAYAQQVALELSNVDSLSMHAPTFTVEVDQQADTLNKRIRQATAEGYHYVIVVGGKEAESGTVSVRRRGSTKSETATAAELKKEFISLEESYQ